MLSTAMEKEETSPKSNPATPVREGAADSHQTAAMIDTPALDVALDEVALGDGAGMEKRDGLGVLDIGAVDGMGGTIMGPGAGVSDMGVGPPVLGQLGGLADMGFGMGQGVGQTVLGEGVGQPVLAQGVGMADMRFGVGQGVGQTVLGQGVGQPVLGQRVGLTDMGLWVGACSWAANNFG